MGVLNPIMLLFGLLAVPLVAMYFIKYRFKDTSVPSTYLWDMVSSDKSTATKFERFKNNPLMWIQLLILILIILALSGFYVLTKKEASGDVLILVDNSIMMDCRENEGSNSMLKAIKDSKEIVDKAAEGTRFTLVSVSDDSQIILSDETDKDIVKNSIDQIESTIKNLSEEKLRKEYKSYKSSKESSTVYVFSSNNGDDIGDIIFRYKGLEKNVGITDMQVYKDKYVVKLTAYGEGSYTNEVTVKVDDKIINIHEVTLSSGEEVEVTGDLTDEGSYISAYLNSGDDISLDNVAIMQIPLDEKIRVFLKSSGNSYLREAMLLRDDISIVDSLDVQEFPQDMDVYVFEDGAPSEIPKSGGILIVNPSSDTSYYKVTEKAEGGSVKITNDETTSFVQAFYTNNYKNITAQNMKAVATVGEDTVITKGMMGDQRAVILGFDIMDTNLPLKYSFPILVQNIVSYLSGSADENLSLTHIADKIDMSLDYADKDVIISSSDNQKKGLNNISWVLGIMALLLLIAEMEVFRREY